MKTANDGRSIALSFPVITDYYLCISDKTGSSVCSMPTKPRFGLAIRVTSISVGRSEETSTMFIAEIERNTDCTPYLIIAHYHLSPPLPLPLPPFPPSPFPLPQGHVAARVREMLELCNMLSAACYTPCTGDCSLSLETAADPCFLQRDSGAFSSHARILGKVRRTFLRLRLFSLFCCCFSSLKWRSVHAHESTL